MRMKKTLWLIPLAILVLASSEDQGRLIGTYNPGKGTVKLAEKNMFQTQTREGYKIKSVYVQKSGESFYLVRIIDRGKKEGALSQAVELVRDENRLIYAKKEGGGCKKPKVPPVINCQPFCSDGGNCDALCTFCLNVLPETDILTNPIGEVVEDGGGGTVNDNTSYCVSGNVGISSNFFN